jgi:hypothetical protein
MRFAALVQAAILGLLAAIVLSKAGLVLPSLAEAFPWLIWLVVVLTAASVALNAISRSAGERRIWLPVGIVLLARSLTVALTAG